MNERKKLIFNNVKFIKQSAEVLTCSGYGELEARRLEYYGRICYNSTENISDKSYETFLTTIIENGHESVLEHGSATVMFVTDRGTTHEIVRHRLASYSQESTRYVAYGVKKCLLLIEPIGVPNDKVNEVKDSAIAAGNAYLDLIRNGVSAENARHTLPNLTATKLIMTANYREWRHFLKLRCSVTAHPHIRQLAREVLGQLHAMIPVIFDDLAAVYL